MTTRRLPTSASLTATRFAARALATGAALVLALAACSGSGSDDGGHGEHTTDSGSATDAATGEFNDADVMFAQMMIPHHEQAVVMSEMMLANPDASTEVRDLAEQILHAQGPEIETMTAWLTAWGAEPMGDHADHGGMEGMLTEEELAELSAATGADVDRLFLTSMIAHHEGAVSMAETEIAEGAAPDAIALAEGIVAAQQAEIATMTEMLGGETS